MTYTSDKLSITFIRQNKVIQTHTFSVAIKQILELKDKVFVLIAADHHLEANLFCYDAQGELKWTSVAPTKSDADKGLWTKIKIEEGKLLAKSFNDTCEVNLYNGFAYTSEIEWKEEGKKNYNYKGFGVIALGIILYMSFTNFYSALVILVLLAVHEGGHALAMMFLGYKIKKFYFIPFFGAAVEAEKPAKNKFDRYVISIAGPLIGFIGGFIGLALYYYILPYNGAAAEYFLKFFKYSMYLNALNLLPIYPLDGGKMLFHCVLDKHYDDFKHHLLTAFSLLGVFVIYITTKSVRNTIFFSFICYNGYRSLRYVQYLLKNYDFEHQTAEDIIHQENTAYSYVSSIQKRGTRHLIELLHNCMHTSFKGKFFSLSLISLLPLLIGAYILYMNFASNIFAAPFKTYSFERILQQRSPEKIRLYLVEHLFENKKDSSILKQKEMEWQSLCDEHKNYYCRLNSYFYYLNEDYKNEDKYLGISCISGDYVSCYNLVIENERVPNEKKLTYWKQVQRRCQQDNLQDACAMLSWISYDLGTTEGKQFLEREDFEKILRENCQAKRKNGCLYLAYFFEESAKYEEDSELILQTYQKGCDQGNKRSCRYAKRLKKSGKEDILKLSL